VCFCRACDICTLRSIKWARLWRRFEYFAGSGVDDAMGSQVQAALLSADDLDQGSVMVNTTPLHLRVAATGWP